MAGRYLSPLAIRAFTPVFDGLWRGRNLRSSRKFRVRGPLHESELRGKAPSASASPPLWRGSLSPQAGRGSRKTRTRPYLSANGATLRRATLEHAACVRCFRSDGTCHTGFQYTPVASMATCVQPFSKKPVGQCQQTRHCRRKRPHLHGYLAPIDNPHRRHHGLLVDVQSGATLMQYFHPVLLPCRRQRDLTFREFLYACSTVQGTDWRQSGVLQGPTVQLRIGLLAPRSCRPPRRRPPA